MGYMSFGQDRYRINWGQSKKTQIILRGSGDPVLNFELSVLGNKQPIFPVLLTAAFS